ncbi:helix-turn-helix domain-containing protein [Lentibacillus salinarum]|uniref:Helix-turn-helix domain-containing protein n=1 Tax=Lentibacillus salinarum TaxID=446820 RepID=A0ABW3ZWJ5_9BACI
MSIEWNLRHIMAKNNIWTGSELLRLMEDKAGYSMSPASISALLNEKPKLIRVETLDAICTALECTPNDLVVHKSTYIGSMKKSRVISKDQEEKKAINNRPLPPV